MKKLVLAAVAASTMAVAAPAFADDTTVAADPYVSTAGLAAVGPGLAGIIFAVIVIAASTGTPN